jgi:hypothetical protein
MLGVKFEYGGLLELGEVSGFRGRLGRWQTDGGWRMEEGGAARHRGSEASCGWQ